MKVKTLKLRNHFELIGDLEIYFHENNSPLVGEKKLADLIENWSAIDFSLSVYGRLWTPGGGGGPHGFNSKLCSLLFPNPEKCVLQTHGTAEFTENIFIPEFFYLLFRELEKTLAENWGDAEPEKKRALADWIKKLKTGMASVETYNKIRGRLDNDRGENLSNPEIVAALNHLARTLGLLSWKTTLYLVEPGYPESKEAKKILDRAGIEYSVLQHAFEDTDKPVLMVDNETYIGLGRIALYAKCYAEGGNKPIKVYGEI
ncbi:MAG: hypothetical protein V1867_07705 [Candidatus Falkowbacteria bacterium]